MLPIDRLQRRVNHVHPFPINTSFFVEVEELNHSNGSKKNKRITERLEKLMKTFENGDTICFPHICDAADFSIQNEPIICNILQRLIMILVTPKNDSNPAII